MKKGKKKSIALRLLKVFGILLFAMLNWACHNEYTPKPHGYFRIDLPEKKYQKLDSVNYPYNFAYPIYGTIREDKSRIAEPFWIDVVFPQFKARIHISYSNIDTDIEDFFEDCRELAYKHTIKADAIQEKIFENHDKRTFGILYKISGNAASSVQFFLSDSIQNHIRGALYFNVHPNKDSLAPVLNFLSEDIIRLIETFEWKKRKKTESM
ncbi:MAG: gliding motility lipoprotein GldD [Bacteroidia bacterium]|nr:MAG: gliding motility lipoprotein GldD [Bacteroidia bacterium]PIE86504.1 MAG: gliding motility lipoprotein GldD [Bacteroidia bacterium]